MNHHTIILLFCVITTGCAVFGKQRSLQTPVKCNTAYAMAVGDSTSIVAYSTLGLLLATGNIGKETETGGVNEVVSAVLLTLAVIYAVDLVLASYEITRCKDEQ